MRPTSFARTVLLVSILALAACDSAEERAEKYYQSGMTLLEAGDVDRALVEFRNVFKLNGKHKEARLAYARVQRERGELQDAYGQYLRVVEQYPDEVEARVALAEMAIESGQWPEAETHGREAAKLAPADVKVRSIVAALDYRKALTDKNDAAAKAADEAAQAVLAEDPKNLIARRVAIDYLATHDDQKGALAQVNEVLAFVPDLIEFQMLKLRLLVGLDDQDGIGAQLQDMFTRFPDNQQVRDLLVSWYMQRGDSDGAATVLRQQAEKTPDEPGPWLMLVQFLQQTKGNEAAQAELARLIAAGGPKVALYKATSAAMQFETNQDPAAIAQMEALLTDAPDTDETRNFKLALAKMLAITGNTVGARARVEEVLATDPTNVEALKMRAAWLIEDDKPGDAILALRTALEQSPRDPSILTMMGEAHERDGSRELAGERYALAAEVSGAGVPESLRYARFLIADNRLDPAAATLETSLNANPGNVDLMTLLADIRMRQSDWDRAATLIAQLRAVGTEQALGAANSLEAGLMLRQQKVDETVNFLQGLVDSGDADTAAVAAIVQTRVQAGDLKAARDYLDQQLAKSPDDPQLQLLNAGLLVLENQPDQAEAAYRALIEKFPQAEDPVRAAYALLVWQGKTAEATTLLDTALKANPDSMTFQMMRASELERANDIDGAIAIYDALYAKDTSNTVLANNLASLIGAHKDDPASLERAFAIARRLRGLDVPAFQDTYGWIEYRRGNYDEALANLEPAAKGLPEDPLVQYHLGKTYLALGRTDEARTQLELALKIAGNSPLPQFADAKTQLETLSSGTAPATQP